MLVEPQYRRILCTFSQCCPPAASELSARTRKELCGPAPQAGDRAAWRIPATARPVASSPLLVPPSAEPAQVLQPSSFSPHDSPCGPAPQCRAGCGIFGLPVPSYGQPGGASPVLGHKLFSVPVIREFLCLSCLSLSLVGGRG